MKKYFLIFASLIFILIPKNVFALNTPTFFTWQNGAEVRDENVSSYSNWAGKSGYKSSIHWNDNSNPIIYQWWVHFDDLKYCDGSPVIFHGSYQVHKINQDNSNNYFNSNDLVRYVTANGRYLNCSVDSVTTDYGIYDTLNFTCNLDSMQGGYFNFYSNGSSYRGSYEFGIASADFSVQCGIGNADIINNNNSNTQNIIINGINDTNRIIDSNGINSQNIINNQNNNANQAHQDSQDIKNAITSDDIPDNNNTQASEWASNNASDGVVSDMVLMPITLLNAFSSGFNGTCQPYNLGSLYGTNLTLPCINIQAYLGSTLWTIIDVLMCGFLIYGIGKKFVKVFNDFTNLKDSQVDELYGGGSE